MSKQSKSSEGLNEQDEKKKLENYDIYRANEKIVKSVLEAEKKKDFIPIDDIEAFYDKYR